MTLAGMRRRESRVGYGWRVRGTSLSAVAAARRSTAECGRAIFRHFGMDTTASVYERVVQTLTSAGLSFREVQHAPTLTSADSARARSEPLEVGAKALLLKCDGEFRLV